MAIDWDVDLSQAVHAQFGAPVTYTSKASGTVFTIADAIFEDAYEGVVLTEDGPKNDMVKPILKVRLSTFPAGTMPQQDDRIVIPAGDGTYIVKQVRPDNVMGDAKLVLQKL